jgi:cell wall-associated NlpC family hydrolase
MKTAIGITGEWFFEDEQAVTLLRKEAASWMGTPFREFSSAKGRSGGVDCVGLAEALMVACGVIKPFTFPRIHADYQSHGTREKVLDYLRGKSKDSQSAQVAARFAEITIPEFRDNLPSEILMPGDLLILRSGSLFHMPIVLEGRRFIHCLRPAGVTEGNIHDTSFSRHLVALFRARSEPL